MTRRRRVLLLLFTTLLVCVLVLWLALPRLAGFAISHWLELPGVSGLSIRFDTIGWQQIRIASLQFRFQTEGGAIADVQARDVLLDIAPLHQQVSRIRVEQSTLTLHLTESDAASDWPTITLPQLPFSDLLIKQLTLVLPAPLLPHALTGSLAVQQDDNATVFWQWHQGNTNVQGEVREQQSALTVDLVLFEESGRDSTARIQLASDPASRPVHIAAKIDLSALENGLRVFAASHALPAFAGTLELSSQISLAKQAGQWQSAETSLHLPSVQIQAEQVALALSGSATLHMLANSTPDASALPQQLALQWHPGTTLHVQMTDSALGSGRVALTEPFTLQWQAGAVQALPGQLSSNDPLRLHWHTTNHGNWQLDLKSLTSADTLTAALQLHGTLPQLAQTPLQASELQIAGPLRLQFWPESGHRLQLVVPTDMQVSADHLIINTGTPWQLTAPTLRWHGQLTVAEDSTGWHLLDADAQLRGGKLIAKQKDAQIQLQDWQSQVQFGNGDWHGDWQTRHAEWLQAGERYSSAPLAIAVKRFDGNTRAELELNASALTSTRLRGWPQPALRATLNLAGTALQFRGSVRAQERDLLQFTGTHDLNRDRGQAALRWQQDLAELDRLLQPRPAALAALGPISGHSDGNVNLQWQLTTTPMPLRMNGLLHLADANASWQQASAKQITAEITLDHLAPLQGRLSISLPAATLAAGMTASDNRLQLELGPEQLKLDHFASTALGGSWQASNDTLPRTPSAKTLPIAVQGLDLAQILALVDLDGLSGDGTLDGVLPLAQEAAGLAVRDGSLQSRVAGVLRYAPDSIAIDNPGLQALRDFHYSQLRVQLDYHADGSYLIQLKLDGNNPAFYYGFPIALTLNLKGQLPGLLRAALLSGDFNAHVLEQLQAGSLQ